MGVLCVFFSLFFHVACIRAIPNLCNVDGQPCFHALWNSFCLPSIWSEVWNVEDIGSELTSFCFIQVWEEPAGEHLSIGEEVGWDVPSSIHPKVRVKGWEGGLTNGLCDVYGGFIVSFDGEALDMWVFAVATQHMASRVGLSAEGARAACICLGFGWGMPVCCVGHLEACCEFGVPEAAKPVKHGGAPFRGGYLGIMDVCCVFGVHVLLQVLPQGAVDTLWGSWVLCG